MLKKLFVLLTKGYYVFQQNNIDKLAYFNTEKTFCIIN
jgi:hypothetical protein